MKTTMIVHENGIDEYKGVKEMSIQKAVRYAFLSMSDVFTGQKFCETVRNYMRGRYPMDGTILRRLREARADAPEFYNYILKDSANSIYQKAV